MSKQLLFDALNCKETKRPAWVPFVGCHGASLINIEADKYLQNEDYIFEGVKKAIELYKPDGIPAFFDLQIEAEALGCQLKWAADNPPSVISHPIAEGVEIDNLSIPAKEQGRIPIMLNVIKRLKETFDDVAIYALVTGPFTLALHLVGADIFTEMYDNPENLKKIISFTKETCKAMSDYYISAGADVIAVVDPMISQISPEHFIEFEMEPVSEIFEYIKSKSRFCSFFVCGNAKRNIELMVKCKPHNISVDENIPLEYLRDIAIQNNLSFGGNIELTSVMLLGNEDDNRLSALKHIETGKNKGYILSPGCDIPYHTPVENIKALAEVIFEEQRYEKYANLIAKEIDISDVRIPDFTQNNLRIDLFTLDSAACAPCQYMVEAILQTLDEDIKSFIKVYEHKIKNMESIKLMKALNVTQIPTILIDGKIEYESIIPSINQLKNKILKALNNKGISISI